MNSIYIISPEPLQATLLKNRIAKYSAEASVQSLLFNDFQPNVLHNPNHAFIFTDEKNEAYAIAEQIRSHTPQCFITFVLTTPDTETVQLFNEHSVSYISLPLTVERYAELAKMTSNLDSITINANGVDRIVHLKQKKYLRLM